MTAPPEPAAHRRSRLGLAALLVGAGATHFLRPEFYDPIVPAWFPFDARATTYASGAAELAVGGLVASQATARLGGWAGLALFVGVYPANVQMCVDAGAPRTAQDWLVWARLPLQVPLFVWAARVARRN